VTDDYKRDTERIDLQGTLQGEVMLFQHTTVCQISKGGMQVETAFPLQLDSLHDFRLTLADKSIVVKGRVVHSKVSEFDQDGIVYRSGIEFIDPPERVSTAIKEFLEALRA
jgi:PilZ domain-containing protein